MTSREDESGAIRGHSPCSVPAFRSESGRDVHDHDRLSAKFPEKRSRSLLPPMPVESAVRPVVNLTL
jgi:hypothetical protein